MSVVEKRLFCPECSRNVLGRQSQTNHFGEMVLIVLTFGLALPLVMLSRILTPSPFLCPNCGLSLRERGAVIGRIVVVAVIVLVLGTLAFAFWLGISSEGR